MHRVGDRVVCITCPTGPWFGRVLAVECLVCGKQLVRDKCPKRHFVGEMTFYNGRVGMAYSLTVGQDKVEGDMRPWCIPEHFPTTGRTAWEHVLEDPLVNRRKQSRRA